MVPRPGRPAAVLAFLLIISTIPGAMTQPAGDEGRAWTGAVPLGTGTASRAIGTVTPIVSPTNESLYAIDWDPSTGNALIGGSSGVVLEYNATTGFRAMPQDQNFTFRYIAFRPLGTSTLALLAGDERPGLTSVLLLYDGTGFTRLSTSAYSEIKGVAWSPDVSYALVAATKGQNGVVLKYQGGSLTEVQSDGSRIYKSLCWGEGGAYFGSFNYTGQSMNIQFFDGATMLRDVLVPDHFDSFPIGLSWSNALRWGVCISDSFAAGGAGKLVRFNATSASNVTGVSIPENLNGVAWAHSRPLALIPATDTTKQQGSDGVLYSYDGSALTVESTDRHWGLNSIAWHASDRYALVVGDNGTVLRFSTPNSKPFCLIENPKPGALVSAITRVNGTALDPDGDPIVFVKVRIDSGPWQDAAGGGNWSFDWDTTTATNGQHTVQAKSSDGVEDSPPEARFVIVSNPNHPPEVTIVSPSEGAGVSGTVVVSGTASDPDAGDAVTLVQVSIDGGQWTAASGTASWSYGWDTLSAGDGTHTVSARCSDGEENSTVASRRVIVQNHGPNAPPTCAFTSPASGDTVSGQVLLQGTAADADNGVLAVFVRVDSGNWMQASGNTSWSFGWNTVPEPGGSHLISARATDGIVNSSEVRITLNVNHPPACVITAPGEGDTVSGVIEIKGAANDQDPGQEVVAVFVRIGTGEWTRANGTSSWSFRWDTNTGQEGAQAIRARSYDGSLYSAEQSRAVTVDKPPAAVRLSEPTSWGIDWVLLVWSRNMDSDFKHYKLYSAEQEGQPLAGLSPRIIHDQSVNLYNYTGLKGRTTYWFRVVVVDETDLTSVSNEVFATTERENTPPVAMLTASRTNAAVGETIRFSADGSYDPDRGGRIVRFQWDFEGRGRFEIDSGPLSTQRHEYSRAGRYTAQVRITDERGASSVASVNITIGERTSKGPDLGIVLPLLVLVMAVAAAAGYLFLRRRPPVVEATYYEEAVHRPAMKRRKQYWPDDDAPGAKRRRPGASG